MTTAAIYARVSSARQREEQTIASQTAALVEYAAGAGLEVGSGWIFEDDGHSGATLVRPGLERLRDVVAEVGIDVVLCYSPDRLARKYVYQMLLRSSRVWAPRSASSRVARPRRPKTRCSFSSRA